MQTESRYRAAWFLSLVAIAAVISAKDVSGQQVDGPSGAQASAPKSSIPISEARRKGDEFHRKHDYAKALHWYRVAADQGDAQSEVAIGDLYSQGEGVKQDYSEALRWYRKAAAQGNDEAQNDIGFFYLSGWGVSRDFGAAMFWLRKAADQGNPVAQRNIGVVYLQGLGVRPDRQEAIRWFRQAANKGDEDAKTALKLLGSK